MKIENQENIINRRGFLKAAGIAATTILPQIIMTKESQSTIKSDETESASNQSLEKILLLSDVHLGQSLNPRRQANSEAASALQELVNHLKSEYFDLLIQLGDMIKEVDNEQVNTANLKRNLEILQQLCLPSIHLLGNHDLWGLSPEQIAKIYQELGLSPDFYGHLDLTNYQLVWLDMEIKKGQHGSLSQDRIDWLRSLDNQKPFILFAHYGLVPVNSNGNYYFNNHPTSTAFTNGPSVLKQLLPDMNITAIISGHIHWAGYSKIHRTHLITVPSFTENIASNNPHHNPGVYSTLELSSNHLTLKSFSGGYCFFNIQV